MEGKFGGGRVIIPGTPDHFTLQRRCPTQERVTYCLDIVSIKTIVSKDNL